MAAQEKRITRYGIEFPLGTNELNLELACYCRPDEFKTGQSLEHHFKAAFRTMWPESTYSWNDFTELMCWGFVNYPIVSVIGCASSGKCHGINTPILMYDGTIKMVQDIIPGDELMGDDSTPRKVITTCRGREKMYRIVPDSGSSWECNESHILSLKASYVPNTRHGKPYSYMKRGDVIDVPLREYVKWSERKKTLWRQYRVGVEFRKRDSSLPIDPYIYGAWLADGSISSPILHKPRGAMSERWCSYWVSRGAEVKQSAAINKCPAWSVSFNGAHGEASIMRRFIETSVKDGEKFIRYDFLTGSRLERMELLAGLLDGDGYTYKGKFEISSKFENLANQIVFLARSLGFHASVSKKRKGIKSIGFIGEYFIIYIGGNLSIVPTLQKKAKDTNQKRDSLITSFKVEPIGDGDYYGFTIDGNHRYLMGDFTVTHNTATFARFALLDYIGAPQTTATSLVTTKFDALKSRLWGELLIGVRSSRVADAINATFKTVSTTNEIKFMLRGDLADQKFMIQGLAVDRGDENAGKLRGQKAPRRRIIADESQDISDGLYMALENGLASAGFKGCLLTNPVEKESKFGNWTKPKAGWGSIDDSTAYWETERGIGIHLDGRQSPNVRARKTIVPFLLSWEYFSSLDPNTLEYYVFGIGFFPTDGLVAKIWNSTTIENAKRSEPFDFATTPCASLDPAFESDECVFIAAQIGTLRNGKPCCCARESIVIKTKIGPEFPEPDIQIANECIRLCKERGIQPEDFIMDMSGPGRGVYAIIKEKWTPLPGRGHIQGIAYGGEATDRPLRLDDPLGAKDQIRYFVTELWFRASYLARDGMLCGLRNIDNKAVVDLDARRYKLKQESEGKRMVAETKSELKGRIGRSPDHGDAFCQLGELMVRKGLLGGKLSTAKASNWQQMRDRARKAQKRFVKEFSHGAT